MNASPMCCGYVSSYVDNVPGKEYYYCRECKNEVLAEPNNELPDFGHIHFYIGPRYRILRRGTEEDGN